MLPDTDLVKKEEIRESKQLDALNSALSEDEKTSLVADAINMQKY
jgi:Zn-dependent M16 (insulinase) family peptidase